MIPTNIWLVFFYAKWRYGRKGKTTMKNLFNLWFRCKTKNLTRIPLFTMIFDYRKYQKYGKSNSCTFYTHPEIAQDEYVKEKLQDVVDYVRDNYDIEKLTRI